MNITILLGSPHREGTTAALAAAFSAGAQAAGHTLTRLDAARMDIAPCRGCDCCRRTGSCITEDDMRRAIPALMGADAVVFVTPLYYFGMSAQLKLLTDRFYSINSALRGAPKRAALLAACSDGREAMGGLKESYRLMVEYLGWRDCGSVLAWGCPAPAALEGRGFLGEAERLGASINNY